jgi:hypothetical protein
MSDTTKLNSIENAILDSANSVNEEDLNNSLKESTSSSESGEEEVADDDVTSSDVDDDVTSSDVDDDVTSSDADTSASDECFGSCFHYTENSDLFAVSVDGIPKFYVKDEKEASEKMWSLTRLLSGQKFCAGYRTNYVQISPNELHIVGSYRFFVIAYDQTLHRISYSKIRECV